VFERGAPRAEVNRLRAGGLELRFGQRDVACDAIPPANRFRVSSSARWKAVTEFSRITRSASSPRSSK
jgi:hypothetical protein